MAKNRTKEEKGVVSDMCIYTYNIRGLRDNKKRTRLFSLFKNKLKGIIFLQETHAVPGDQPTWQKEWGNRIYMSYGTNQARGVAILMSNNIEYEIDNVETDSEGRYISLEGTFNGHKLCLLNAYAPTADKIELQNNFLDKITPIMDRNAHKLILAGDLNCHLTQTDKYGPNYAQTKFASRLNIIIEEQNLMDVWRILNPDIKRYTWRKKLHNNIQQSRLDYSIIASSVLYNVKECQVQTAMYSDHNPVQLTLRGDKETMRGRGFWKLNASLLKDKEYLDTINAVIEREIVKNQKLENKGLLWDIIKMEIRSASISYSAYKAKKNRENEQRLNSELRELEHKMATDPDEDTKMHYYTNIKELEEINNHRARGQQVRARAMNIEYNEKNSNYFYQKEVSNAKAKNIATIQKEDGTIVTEPQEIMTCQKEYYQKLYTEPIKNETFEQIEPDEFLMPSNVTKIKQEDKTLLEAPVTINEISKAVILLPNAKAPGTDGLPIDFYKVFWNKINTTVYNSIHYAIETKSMSMDQRRGILSLIPKKGKDTRMLKNWRPLTLLNADYKILAKVMATRLQLVLPSIVSSDQSGCIKGRSTFNNIRSAIDIINYANLESVPGILAYIDFEKAFDTVKWQFMHKTLEAMNFGPNYINYIKTMYYDIEACVMNNGHTSAYFKPTRGIRQGCPVSAYLFLLIVETMANAIKNNDQIKGIKINGREYKISQYADDTCLYLQDENSLKVALNTFENFYKCTGLKMNREKSEAIWIGASSNYRHKPFKLKWTKGATYLGIYISNDVKEINQKNFGDKIEKVKELLNMWTLRKMTIRGKIQIINTLIIPQMLYPSTVLAIPKSCIDEYNHAIIKFLWNNKPAKVKYRSLINTIDKGGLKLQDLQSKVDSIKIKWIKQMEDNECHSPWKGYLEYIIKDKCTAIPHYNYNIAEQHNINDGFYKQVFDIWRKIKINKVETYEDICRQPIWNNQNITVGNRTIAYNQWHNQGIRYIGDIIDDKGNIMTQQQIEQEYSITSHFLQYQSLSAAIPKHWKTIIKENKGLVCFDTNEQNCAIKMGKIYEHLNNVSTKEIYWHLVNTIATRPTSESKWNEKLPFIIDENMWTIIYTNYQNITTDTYVMNIQYKITHRILACNKNLFTWKIRPNSECDQCNCIDTIEHFLVECDATYTFWKQVFNWWAANMEAWFQVETYEIIFGIPNECNETTVTQINFIIMYGKQYIYKNKKKEKPLHLYEFLLDCKNQMEIKKEIMASKGKIDKFNLQWGELYNTLN
jgi:hypothetical protein